MKRVHTQKKSARRKFQGGFGMSVPSSWHNPFGHTVATNILKLAEKRNRGELKSRAKVFKKMRRQTAG